MIETVNEDYLLSVCSVTSSHNSELSCIVTVLCKECPVSCLNSVNHQFSKLNHLVRRGGCTVCNLSLLHSSLINIGVIVTEDVGTVCAHIVDEFISVNIPKICALSLLREERPCTYGNEVTFSRAKVTVNT